MSKAVVGNPDQDRRVIQQFNEAFVSVAGAVRDVLGDQGVLRNLSQDTLDDVETSLLETQVEIDRGFVVFAKRRTIRTKQSVGGAVGTMTKRLADLEGAGKATTAGSLPAVSQAEEHNAMMPVSIEADVEEIDEHAEESVPVSNEPDIELDIEDGDDFISVSEDGAEATDEEVNG